MKPHQTLALLAVSSSLSLGAIAHEHGSHKQGHGSSKYDCEAVRKMDHSTMDMNDPHMQDMMKSCGAHGYKSDNQHGHGHGKQDDKGARSHNDGHGGHGGHGRSGHQ